MAGSGDRVRPYGSMLMAEPAIIRDRVVEANERGFRSIKISWGPFGRRGNARTDEAIVAAAREAAGDDVEIMLDAGGSEEHWPHGYKWALRTSQMLAAYGICWFEEPLAPDDIDSYVELTRSSTVPISGGEVLTRRQSFREWIERRAVDYIQPDVTKVGGISEQHLIGERRTTTGSCWFLMDGTPGSASQRICRLPRLRSAPAGSST